MGRKLNVRVDHDKCMGNAICITIATKTFALNDENQSEALDPQGDSEELVLEAADNCPVGAISVEDAETGETLYQ